MSSPHPLPTPQEDENTEFYRAALHEIISLGTALARQIQAATLDAEAALPLPEAAAAFERTTRAVRRSILLATRLNQAPEAQNAATRNAEKTRTAARKRIIREVEDNITRARRPESEADALQAEFQDRLDSPDLLDEIDTRPTPEIIADILRDLDLAALPGMGRPWRRRTPADITHLLARASHPPRQTPTPQKSGPSASPPIPGRPTRNPPPEPRPPPL